MASIQQIINKGDVIIADAETEFLSATKDIEEDVFLALMKIFENVDISNGRLSSSTKAEEFLASMDARVYMALKKAGYGNYVNRLVNSYDLIGQNTQDLQEKLKNGIIPKKDINAIKRLEVEKTIANLTEQGLYNAFIAPVRQGLYRNIMFGATKDDTEEFLRSYVKSTKKNQSKLLQYVGQVAVDSLHQYSGSVDQVAKNSLDLNATQYVGSLITDSRAQCQKWISLGIIKDEDLQEEIDFALDRSYYGNKRCSGMIPDTNTSNFCINRGGYRCRHRAIPIRLVKPKK
jgi:hypothetical protein